MSCMDKDTCAFLGLSWTLVVRSLAVFCHLSGLSYLQQNMDPNSISHPTLSPAGVGQT
jgi:hypothetical protein